MKILIIIAFTISIAGCGSQDTVTVPKEVIEQKENELQEAKEQLDKERAERLKQENESTRLDVLNRITDYLPIKESFPDPGTGGINNGTVIVQNLLENVTFQKVVIEVNIILANGNIYKSNYFTLKNLQPGDVETLNIPNSGNRGIDVNTTLIRIQSNELTKGEIITLNRPNDDTQN